MALASALAIATALPAASGADTITRLVPSGDTATVRIGLSNGAQVIRHLDVEQNKSVRLVTEFSVKRVSVGNPEIADVVVLGSRELNLVAKQVGETNVVLWDSSGKAQAAIDLAVGRPYAKIEAEIGDVLGNEDIRIESAGESIVLKGTVSGVEDVDRAIRVTSAYFPEKKKDRIINLLDVGGNQQVMIEVTIAEMSRRITKEMESNFSIIGEGENHMFSFRNFINNLVSLDQDVDTMDVLMLTQRVNLAAQLINANSGSVTLFLNFLQEQGLVKILAEPTLVARSGQSASFLVGGEVPIPIAQGGAFVGAVTIEFKEFGVLVSFTPTVLSGNRIHMEVSPEVSEPDFTIGATVSGFVVPGFTTRRVSTGVELGDGQSFAIAGLLRDDVRELASKYPLLGDIPILGALFRSKSYQKNETELVMIVRPRLVKPLPPGEYQLPTDNFIEPTDYEFYLTPAIEGREPVADDSDARATGMIGDAGHRLSISETEKELQ